MTPCSPSTAGCPVEHSGAGPLTARFDALVHPTEPWAALVARWQRLERAGLDGIWSCDHYAPEFDPRAPWFEGATTLMAMAAVTSRVRIGLLVGAISSRSPALFASEAKTIDHASGGRLDVGLGAGGSTIDAAMTGRDRWGPAERLARLHEYVELVDMLCRQDRVTYRGTYYRVEDATVAPPLVQRPRPPITVAAQGPRTLEVVARHADTWNTFGPSLQMAVENSHRLDEICERIGRDPATISRSALLGAFPETGWTTAAEFAELVARWWGRGFTHIVFYSPPFAMADIRAASPRVENEVLDSTIPELRRRLAAA